MDLASGLPDDQLADVANIHRIVGDFSFTASSVNNIAYGRFGIISVRGDAFAAGSVPETIGDFEAPWWYSSAFATDGDLDHKRLEIDFKLNRRYNKGDAIAFILDVSSQSNVAIEWGIHLRLLYSHK